MKHIASGGFANIYLLDCEKLIKREAAEARDDAIWQIKMIENGWPMPKIYDFGNGYSIMDYIDSITYNNFIINRNFYGKKLLKYLYTQFDEFLHGSIWKLISHCDLNRDNILIEKNTYKIYFIDPRYKINKENDYRSLKFIINEIKGYL